MREKLDPRCHAYRDDLADIALKKRVNADKFIAPSLMQIGCGVANVYKAADTQSPLTTQFLLGQEIKLFEEKDGFCWVQSSFDQYVGYVVSDSLTTLKPATHRLNVARSFVYRAPDLRAPCCGQVSLGAKVTLKEIIATKNGDYAKLEDGTFVFYPHLWPIDAPNSHYVDYVSVAESLANTPYLWGGASALGIDCSGLVQLSMAMVGQNVARDSDQQAQQIGQDISRQHGLKRGDLVFWPGHVAIMCDSKSLIHANAKTMSVAVEALDIVETRFKQSGIDKAQFKRP